MKVAVTGSHGLIGQELVRVLSSRGDEIVRLVRSKPGVGEVLWDPAGGTIDAGALDGVDAVVHLAGAGIGDRRWTPTHKAKILDSRVRGTHLIAETVAGLEKKPEVLISASGIGFYGNRADEVLTEESTKGEDFLAHVVDQWETSTAPAENAGIRVVKIRTAPVLSKKGGVLPKMLLPFRFFVGGRLGSGRQYLSWISLEDETRAILHLLDSDVSGPVNLTSPAPVTNAEFTKVLGEVMHRPAFLAVPAFALKLALGSEMAEETVLVSQRALPARLESSGYTFRHPDLHEALRTELT